MATSHDARMLTPAQQETLRVRAVTAVVEQGVAITRAAKLFGVSRSSVWKWVRDYRRHGSTGLASRRKGPPKGEIALRGWQAAWVCGMLTNRTPDQLLLPFMLWTRQAVVQLIWDRFRIRISVWTAGRYLKRWGFTPQKPARRAFEADSAAVRRWLEHEYPAIQKAAKAARAEIHWLDEMGLRSDHQTGTTYGLRGQTPVIAGTGKRFRINVISSVTNRGTLRFRTFDGTFTQAVLIDFLSRLIQDVDQKVFVIMDGHPAHRGKQVAEWVAARSEKIAVHLLPAYSPELNPDELLNNDLKGAMGRERPHTKDQMQGNLTRRLQSIQRRPHHVRSYFDHPKTQYAAE